MKTFMVMILAAMTLGSNNVDTIKYGGSYEDYHSTRSDYVTEMLVYMNEELANDNKAIVWFTRYDGAQRCILVNNW